MKSRDLLSALVVLRVTVDFAEYTNNDYLQLWVIHFQRGIEKLGVSKEQA